MNFSSDNIQLFLAVLDRGSFSAAARALKRVPSAVSMAIAQLEAELDLPLFDRATRKALPLCSRRRPKVTKAGSSSALWRAPSV